MGFTAGNLVAGVSFKQFEKTFLMLHGSLSFKRNVHLQGFQIKHLQATIMSSGSKHRNLNYFLSLLCGNEYPCEYVLYEKMCNILIRRTFKNAR